MPCGSVSILECLESKQAADYEAFKCQQIRITRWQVRTANAIVAFVIQAVFTK